VILSDGERALVADALLDALAMRAMLEPFIEALPGDLADKIDAAGRVLEADAIGARDVLKLELERLRAASASLAANLAGLASGLRAALGARRGS
jgi:hypothetical protein